MAWIFLLDRSYWFARISRLYGIACIGSLVLFRQQHGAVLTIINDVHLCCDQLFCLRNVRHFKLRLLRSMVYNLQTVWTIVNKVDRRREKNQKSSSN